jgi:PAS domain S-box-containing protein
MKFTFLKNIEHNLTFKLVLFVSLISLSTLIINTKIIFDYIEAALIEENLGNMQAEIEVDGQLFSKKIDQLVKDLYFFANVPPIQGIIRSQYAGGIDPYDNSTIDDWKSRLKHLFTELLKNKPYYLQIRFIGVANNGKELVRVDRSGPGSTIRAVTENELQQKADRPYFIKAIQDKAKKVSLSKIGYSRENEGEISLPVTPVIRASYPIYDSSGNIFGLVIINNDINYIFEDMEKTIDTDHVLNIANANGDYLLHHDENKIFRFEYGESVLMQDDYSELIPVFNDINTDIIFGESKNNEEIFVFKRLQYFDEDKDNVLGVLISKDKVDALALFNNISKQLYLVLLVSIIIILFLSLLLIRKFSSPFQKIIHAAENIAIGETNIDLPDKDTGLAGVVARAFSEMLQKLRSREEKLLDEITKRKKSEQENNAVLKNAVDGIISIDAKGIILKVNPAAEQLFGYNAKDMLGHNVKMLMPSPYYDEHDGYLKNYHETGERKIIGSGREVIGKRKDGSTFPMELSVSENKIGDSHSFTGIVRDISEQVEYQKKIEDQKDYYEHLFKFLNVPAFILDNDHKVVMWNKACEEMTGVMADDLLGTRDHSLAFYKETRPVLADVVLDGIDASDLYEFDIEESMMPGGIRVQNWIDRPHKGGGLIYINVEAGPVYMKGEQVGAIEIIQDISSIKKLEESLKNNNEQLKRSNEELERFAYVASHDLQEPLRMVASYTDLLAKRYKDKLDDDANDFIRFAVDGAKRMQALINDLLAFSRLNNVSEEFNAVDTNVLVDEVIEMVNNLENNIVITKDKLPEVKGLEVTLRQLFHNLIFNAVKYSDPDRKNEIHISAENQDETWAFSISDTGIGIAPEYFEKIFVIFKRLHNKETYSGTGIGLALCKKIVEQHGGKIWVESVPDKGSTFSFTLLKL